MGADILDYADAGYSMLISNVNISYTVYWDTEKYVSTISFSLLSLTGLPLIKREKDSKRKQVGRLKKKLKLL